MEKRDFDKAAESYDLKPGRLKLAQDVAKAIINEVNLSGDMDVLDFGCGTGLVTLQLQPRVRTITGVDSSHGMLDVLKSKIKEQNMINVKTEFIDMEKGDTLKGNFHLIISSMTLHHIQDLEYLLRQFYNCLLPGGVLCIADLDSDGGEFHSDQTGVVHAGFERSDFRRLFNRCGFHGLRDVTVARVVKELSDGRVQEFTVFLMIGRK